MKTKSWGSALKERVYGHALLSSFIHLIQITAYGDQTGCAVLYIFYDAVQRKWGKANKNCAGEEEVKNKQL